MTQEAAGGGEWRSGWNMELWFNRFVRIVALLERAGNFFGALDFILATTMVVGGFSDYLDRDFWYTTTIVFFEGCRIFSRQTRTDDHIMFKAIGSIQFKRVNLGNNSGSLYFANAVMMLVSLYLLAYAPIAMMLFSSTAWRMSYALTVILVSLLMVYNGWFYKLVGHASKRESMILFQFSAPAALLLSKVLLHISVGHWYFDHTDYTAIAFWFILYLVARFGSPVNCLLNKAGAKGLHSLLLMAVICEAMDEDIRTILFVLGGIFVVGSIQTQLASIQIIVSYCYLVSGIEVNGSANKNVKPALKMVYGLALTQGILYMAACGLESFSFLLRKTIALTYGLTDISGMSALDLYYEHCYATFLHKSILDSTQKRSLVRFAIESLKPEARHHKKRAAVRILNSVLQKQKASSSESDILSLITTSNNAVMTLINILGWQFPQYDDLRLRAAKVVVCIAPYLHINEFPALLQLVLSLVDSQVVSGGMTSNQQIIGNGRQKRRTADIEGGNRPEALVCKLWQHFQILKSVPHADSEDTGSLSALGLNILNGLSQNVQNFSEEFLRATEVLIRCFPGPTVAQREEFITSWLKLIAKLSGVKGEVGVKLRQGLTEGNFLILNFVEVLELEGSSSYVEHTKLVFQIIANVSIAMKTRNKIGSVPMVISKLLKEFIGEESQPLRAEAGAALAMLALESPQTCYDILTKAGNKIVVDLTFKFQKGQYVYPAARLLYSLCKHSMESMSSHECFLDYLMTTLAAVLGWINDAEGKEMTALIGLASETFNAMPAEGIALVLDSSDGAFVKKMVQELYACSKASPEEFAGMGRVLVELTTSVVKSSPRYSMHFKATGTIEVLTRLEQCLWMLVPEEQGAMRVRLTEAKALIEADQHGDDEILSEG
ncbi:uncharacterized protein LOC125513470 isoform X4 [Triticum urartu]|uniref:uncharacterized protein LOC125513470 isoform X4 n=1 Tax=Triticum urartu TaxID=4572 RepID=UPI002044A8A3|nr:uncharacterized protein LOC125513470 isoform X4 [Triticum urartu]